MNKFKFLSFLIIATGLFISSCTIDDDYPVERNTNITEVSVSPVAEDMYAGEGVDYRFRFQASQAIAQDMLIEFTSPSGVEGSVILPAGSTMSPMTTTQFPVDTVVEFEGTTETLSLDMRISVLNKPEDLRVSGSGSLSVTVFDKLPATEAGKLNILVDWEGGETGSPDMEVFLITGNQDVYGNAVDYADTWGANNRWEEVALTEASYADGYFSYFLREYYGNYPVTYKIFIRESSGALTLMEGTMADGPLYGGNWIFTINKSTVGGTVNYTYNQL